MQSNSRIQAIQHTLASIFAAQKVLQTLAPEYGWNGLGNLLGDFGECIAIEHYGWEKAPKGASGYDAVTPDGHTVQIKTNYAASIGFRGEADLMLVLQVTSDGTWQEIYLRSFHIVKAAAHYSGRDNKSMVAVAQLRNLQSRQKSLLLTEQDSNRINDVDILTS